jgi:hypothetical protein
LVSFLTPESRKILYWSSKRDLTSMTFDESTVACILVKVKITSIGEEHCFIIQSETLNRSSHLPFACPAELVEKVKLLRHF